MGFSLGYSGSSLLSAMVLALAVVGCGSQLDSDDGEGAGGAEVAGTSDALTPDLFACGLPVDCVMDSGHLGESITPEMVKCQSDLTLAGKPAVLMHLGRPGPYATETEALKVLRGDGTAFYQYRSRCMFEGACEDQDTTAWRRADLERCDVVQADVKNPPQCGEGEEQCVYPALENCVVIGLDFSCDDITP